ncbi:MAG: hypothetical protein GF364_15525 [Candidatus Lokiarchaeota archaeon]|nr:hypothetical protein [Candidatus Lokiarchaeota archaeon]
MTKKDKDSIEEGEQFVEIPEDDLDEKRFSKHRKYAYLITFITFVVIILLDIFLKNNRGIENTIIAWFIAYLWILPYLYYQMRHYKFSFHIREYEQIAKIYTILMVYFLIVCLLCFIALLFLIIAPPTWLVPAIYGFGLLFLLPAIVLALVIER